MISKYTIVENTNSFTISARDRVTTTVELVGDQLPYFKINNNRVELIKYSNLMQKISQSLFSEWESPKNKSGFIPKWILNSCQNGIGKRVYEQWKRLLDRCDQKIVNIQRKVFSVHGHLPDQMQYFPGFYKHKYLTNDLLSLRSGCASVIYASIHNNNVEYYVKYPYKEIKPEEWMKIYSNKKYVYPALGQTLNNLPGGISVKNLYRLSDFLLKRPLLSRLELSLNIANIRNVSLNFDVFHFATPQDIKLAAKRVGDHLRNKINLRKFSGIVQLTNFLTDYPDNHNGRLPGLAEKSIRWHRRGIYQHAQRELELLKLNGYDKNINKQPNRDI